MNMPYTRAPHRGDAVGFASSGGAPNAALLIDFDNVTMGMRSDLRATCASFSNLT